MICGRLVVVLKLLGRLNRGPLEKKIAIYFLCLLIKSSQVTCLIKSTSNSVELHKKIQILHEGREQEHIKLS